jgi:nicotinate-nucleotide pyrophosphorylase (carboxylating)
MHAVTLPDLLLEPIVRLALLEDLTPAGDLTAMAALPADRSWRAVLRSREPAVLAGSEAACLALRLIDPSVQLRQLVDPGAQIEAGEVFMELEGNARSIVSAERTMLNFLGHLSGIATLTQRYVSEFKDFDTKVSCRRKTTPGLRILEKHAVRLGGGSNHRYGLGDAVLIKDNHIAAAGSIAAALSQARNLVGHMRVIEIEVDTLDQLQEALAHNPDSILLDNMSIDELRQAVAMRIGNVVLEASGNVRLETIRQIAATGVDFISVGAITHSARRIDMGLDAI